MMADKEGNRMNEEMVTITKDEYESLTAAAEFLNCLEACGVDNWGGYGDAQDMMDEDE